MMRDSLLNGLFVGLLVYAAAVCPNDAGVLALAAGMAGGLCLGIVASAIRSSIGKLNLHPALLVLEHPQLIQAGIVFGLCLATFLVRTEPMHQWLLTGCAVGGVAIGAAMQVVRLAFAPMVRIVTALAAAVILVATCLWVFMGRPAMLTELDSLVFGRVLLVGLPFFCVLGFVEQLPNLESEAATLCALLAVGLWLSGTSFFVAVVAPLALYYLLVVRWLPHLPGLKAILRGRAYASAGQQRHALAELGQAARLQPDSKPVRDALWKLHQGLDVNSFAADPELANYIDPHLCLDRVTALLNEPPTKVQLAEANQLLNLVERRDAGLRATVAYWRAVAATHGHDIEVAATQLAAILDPSVWQSSDENRKSILFAAWQLAILSHPQLEELVGQPQLAQPGRLVEAISAVERRLDDAPDDSMAWSLKRLLYPQLTEQHLASTSYSRIDPQYVEQLGLAMIQEPAKRSRGAEFLLIAARENPADAPRLCLVAAEALDASDKIAAINARQRGLDAVRQVGAHTLSEPARQAYFTIVKWMAEEAASRGDTQTAIGLYQIYTECDRSGVDTLRTLADLHEQRKDVWPALHAVARALIYDAKDADLLAKRDRYLYSIEPEQLRTAEEPLRRSVDVEYCVAIAQRLLDLPNAGTDLIDWSKHLAELAVVLQPNRVQPRLSLARAKLRLGEKDQALQLLEDILEQKPGKLAGDAEEEAWFTANRLLGDLYLNDYDRPDLAIGCFTSFRDSARSGADTLYKLGLAHERTGDRAKAATFFKHVLGYDHHPREAEAREGLRRVQS